MYMTSHNIVTNVQKCHIHISAAFPPTSMSFVSDLMRVDGRIFVPHERIHCSLFNSIINMKSLLININIK